MFAERVKDITASGIRKVFDLASRMEDPINFSIGQADFDVPEPIKQAAIAAIEQGHNRYTVTQGIEPLREVVTQQIEKTRGYRPEGLLITSGTSGGLLLAMMVLVNPGEEVLLPDPYFVMYKHLAHLAGAVPKYYNLYPDFQLQPQEIEKQITEKTKVLLINSPSNPTGAVFSKEALLEVAEIAKKHDLIILSDEIYDAFVYDLSHHSIASFYPKTVLLGGFSKTYGMPGWRMGFAAGPFAILDKMTTLQQFSFVCAPTPAQYACLKSFEMDMSSHIENYKNKRNMIYQGLLDRGYKVHKPGGSFYIFPEVPWGTDQEFCEAAIAKEMLIIPGSAFSAQHSHFRISFAVTDDKIRKGLDLLGELATRK